MKTVQIEGGISLTEEQVIQAYKKLQEPEFEYPAWFINNELGYVVRFDAVNEGEVVVEKGYNSYPVGYKHTNWVRHTATAVWTQVDEPKLYERCKEGYAVYGEGFAHREDGADYYNNFNIYPTAELAAKAAKLMHESNKLIMACLLEDPDYEPDWSDASSRKHSTYFDVIKGEYVADFTTRYKGYAAHVSTAEKAKEVAKRMNAWREL